jgi:hypothetical protein
LASSGQQEYVALRAVWMYIDLRLQRARDVRYIVRARIFGMTFD